MKTNFSKITENLANIAIITVALLLGIVLVKNFILTKSELRPNGNQTYKDPRVPAGTKISLPNTDWAKNQRTLIMAVSETCHFCSESAEFYKRLVQENTKKNSFRIIAVLPQDVDRGKAYLNKLGVLIDDIRQVQFNTISVKATPTLIMVDVNGNVIESWVGKLSSDKEAEVLRCF